jgi:hypothetical protein
MRVERKQSNRSVPLQHSLLVVMVSRLPAVRVSLQKRNAILGQENCINKHYHYGERPFLTNEERPVSLENRNECTILTDPSTNAVADLVMILALNHNFFFCTQDLFIIATMG